MRVAQQNPGRDEIFTQVRKLYVAGLLGGGLTAALGSLVCWLSVEDGYVLSRFFSRLMSESRWKHWTRIDDPFVYWITVGFWGALAVVGAFAFAVTLNSFLKRREGD